MSKSALSAALLSKDAAPTQQRPTGESKSSTLSRSAFPCLYQDAQSTEDTFEVEVNLNKLSLGTSPGPSSFRRPSVDGRRSLDDPVSQSS